MQEEEEDSEVNLLLFILLHFTRLVCVQYAPSKLRVNVSDK
jgi:hypothetical protein